MIWKRRALLFLIPAICSICSAVNGQDIAPILWYGMMPHPYIAQVQKGAEAAASDYNIKIDTTVGEEWTQANETQNIEQQSARGYKAISLFPGIWTAVFTHRQGNIRIISVRRAREREEEFYEIL
jgi:uncharacterized DUF497 family protein